MDVRIIMIAFHQLVLALVLLWSQVTAEMYMSPVEISIPPVLNLAEDDSNVLCASLSLRTKVNINFNLALDSSGSGAGMCVQEL